jgi:hypothetical protein
MPAAVAGASCLYKGFVRCRDKQICCNTCMYTLVTAGLLHASCVTLRHTPTKLSGLCSSSTSNVALLTNNNLQACMHFGMEIFKNRICFSVCLARRSEVELRAGRHR